MPKTLLCAKVAICFEHKSPKAELKCIVGKQRVLIGKSNNSSDTETFETICSNQSMRASLEARGEGEVPQADRMTSAPANHGPAGQPSGECVKDLLL